LCILFVLGGFLANPLAVGLVASFALGGRKGDPGWHAPITAILVWTGTLTLFFPLAVVYFQVIKEVPHRYFFTSTSLFWAPAWLLLGFLLALIGGLFGRAYSNLVVERL
jgi:H+/Cl- antiporter ClcA